MFDAEYSKSCFKKPEINRTCKCVSKNYILSLRILLHSRLWLEMTGIFYRHNLLAFIVDAYLELTFDRNLCIDQYFWSQPADSRKKNTWFFFGNENCVRSCFCLTFFAVPIDFFNDPWDSELFFEINAEEKRLKVVGLVLKEEKKKKKMKNEPRIFLYISSCCVTRLLQNLHSIHTCLILNEKYSYQCVLVHVRAFWT